MSWWNLHDRFLRHDSLLYNVGLYDIGNRSFEDPGDCRPGHGLRHPPECPHNPLIVLNSAKRVARSGLNSPDAEITPDHQDGRTPIPRMGQQRLVNRHLFEEVCLRSSQDLCLWGGDQGFRSVFPRGLGRS